MEAVWRGNVQGIDLFLMQFPALKDNYSYLLYWDALALAFDPAEAQPLLDMIKEKNLKLHAIFNTHHHSDHVKGNEELKSETECSVLGPDDENIPFLDQGLHDGEELIIGPLRIHVIATPGHTLSHIVFYLPDLGLLFSGDTLFGAGCGRLFEGTPEEMLDSLEKIKELPPSTKIFCGHEYTVANLSFAHMIEPQNKEIKERLDHAKSLREAGRSTLPLTLDEELCTNPFLRVQDTDLRKALNMQKSTDIEVFYELRKRRDSYTVENAENPRDND